MRADSDMTPRLSRRQTLQQLAAAGLGSLTSTMARGASPETRGARPQWHRRGAHLSRDSGPARRGLRLGRPAGVAPRSDVCRDRRLSRSSAVPSRGPRPAPSMCGRIIRPSGRSSNRSTASSTFSRSRRCTGWGRRMSPRARFVERVRGWTAPVPYLAQYERHRHPVFRFQLARLACRPLLGLPMEPVAAEFSALPSSAGGGPMAASTTRPLPKGETAMSSTRSGASRDDAPRPGRGPPPRRSPGSRGAESPTWRISVAAEAGVTG